MVILVKNVEERVLIASFTSLKQPYKHDTSPPEPSLLKVRARYRSDDKPMVVVESGDGCSGGTNSRR